MHSCLVIQSCLTFCDPMDCSPPGSSVHGVFQAILEWVVVSYSRASSLLRDLLYSNINSFKKIKEPVENRLSNRDSTGLLPEDAEKEHWVSSRHRGGRDAHGGECAWRQWARGPHSSVGDGKETRKSEMGMKAYGRREMKVSIMETGTRKWECHEFYPRAYLRGKISIGYCVRNLSFH